MNIDGKYYRSIWLEDGIKPAVCVFNQQLLPFEIRIEKFMTAKQIISAIKNMTLRGAPLIGAAGALGVYLAENEHHQEIISGNQTGFIDTIMNIKNARPTAVNLGWAIERVFNKLNNTGDKLLWSETARREALQIVDEDAEMSRQIGLHGVELIKQIARNKNGKPVNVLTHCNAGWLATIDFGTALAPIYEAFAQKIPVHVWVDETRPRNQGARLTAWELDQANIPHTIVADNTGGHLMQHEMVDICIVGCDRATLNGDAANKIGTYLKALAAKDNNIPFYVALPSSTFDWKISDGCTQIPIEERDPDEVRFTEGWYDGKPLRILTVNPRSSVLNYSFDVTPARLITGFITERGICSASKDGLKTLFPDKIIGTDKSILF